MNTARSISLRGYKRQSVVDNVFAYLFLLPSIVLFVMFTVIPCVVTVCLTFFEWNMLTDPIFVGSENYRRFLSDPRLLRIVTNTLKFTGAAVVLKVVMGLVVALLVQSVKVKPIATGLESVFFFPVILPMAIVALVWGMFLNTEMGVINGILSTIGLGKVPWLTNGRWALRSVVLLDVWKATGFFFIIYLVALRNVPKEYYEAAQIDGAGPARRFFSVTLPLISPTTLFLIIIAIIDSLKVFDQAYILTRGGPGDATTTIVIYVFQTAFRMLDMGYGATLATLLFLFTLLVTIAQFGMSRKWVFYE